MDVCGKYNWPSQMNFEKFRLESFIDWPKPWIDVREMASNGFYYIGREDKVTCFFCKLHLCEFEADDIPNELHSKWSIDCPLFNHEKTTNITLKDQKEYHENKFNLEPLIHALTMAWSEADFKNPDDDYAYIFNQFDYWYKRIFVPEADVPERPLMQQRTIDENLVPLLNPIRNGKLTLWKFKFARHHELCDVELENFDKWYRNNFIKANQILDLQREKQNNDDFIWQAMHNISIVAANAIRTDASNGAKEALKQFNVWYKQLYSANHNPPLPKAENKKSLFKDVCG